MNTRQTQIFASSLLSCLLVGESAGAATLFSYDYDIAGFGDRTERVFSSQFTVSKPWTLDAVSIEVTHLYASELQLSLSSPGGDVFYLLNRNGARTRVGAGTGALAGLETYTLVESGAPLGGVTNWDFKGYQPGGTYNALTWPTGTLASGVWTIALTNVNVSGSAGGAVGNVSIVGQAGPPCVPAPQGIVAWWPGESNTWDVIGGYDGNFGPQPPPNSQLYTNGVVGSAFKFPRTWFLTVPPAGALDPGAGEGFTFETWMNPESKGSRGVFGWGISQVRLHTGQSAELQAYLIKINGQAIVLRSAPSVVQTNTWQHVALTCNTTNGEAVLYLNGSPVAQTNIGPGALRTSGTLTIGSADGRGYFDGSMDEPALYARALSHTEIQSIYLAESGGKCPPPFPQTCTPAPADVVAWWPGESNTWDVAGGLNASFGFQPPPTALTYSNGLVGTAFRFQSSWLLTVPATPALDLEKAGGFAFEAWLKPDPGTGTLGIMGWGGTPAGQPTSPIGVHLFVTSQNTLHATLIRTNGQTLQLQSPLGAIVRGAWQHVVLSCNTGDGDAALYINGSQLAEMDRSATGLQTGGPFTLGAVPSPFGARFSGLLDEPTLYSRALALSEIRSIYEARRYGKCPLPPRNCQVTQADIAGWWRGESNALDSVTTNHGIMQPNVMTPQFYTNGVSGTAFALRYGNHVMVPGSPSLDVGSGPGLTVEAWVNPASSSVYPLVEWNSGTGIQGVHMEYSTSRGPAYMEANLVDDQGQSHVVLSSFIAPVANQWRHVAVTYEKASGAAVLFVDGTAVTQTNLGSFTPRTTGNLYLGYRPPGQYPGSGSRFYGLMDEITVYRRALSPEEIRCLIINRDAGKYPPLAECVMPTPGIFAWWRGEHNVQDSVGDSHGYPNLSMIYTNGRVGMAFDTDSGRLVAIPLTAGVNIGASAGLTVEGWIYPRQPAASMFFSWTGGLRLGYGTQGAGSLRADLPDTNGVQHFLASATGVVQTSRWQHVALAYDKATGWGSLYVDGTPVASANLGIFTPRTLGSLTMGGGFRGALDEFAIHQRALSAFEIAAIARSANGRCMEPPVIVQHPQSLRINAGTDVLFSVEASGNPLLRYRWFKNGNPAFNRSQEPVTNTVLALSNVTEFHQGVYHAQVTNAFGTATSSNAVLLVNYPPVADASATRNRFIIPPCTNIITAVLDGSLSTDPDNDPLAYTWQSSILNSASSAIATGLVAIVPLPEGVHPIDLVVDDGLLQDTNAVTIEVLSTVAAIDDLIAAVRASSLKSSYRMVMALHLSLAQRFLERDKRQPALVQLEVFKGKVRNWVQSGDPALAAVWTAEAQAIIDAIQSCCGRGLSPLERLLELVRASELPPQLKAVLEAKLMAAIEACNRGDDAAAELNGFIAAAGTGDTGEALAGAAQEALNEELAPRGRLRAMAGPEHGRIRLEFAGTRGGTYIVEASTDMQRWEAVGVARETAGGTFEFEHSTLQTQACRFYRIVMP